MPGATVEDIQHETIESPYRLAWTRVGKVVIPLLLIVLAASYWFIYIYIPAQIEPESPKVVPTTKIATPSAKKDETAGWEVYKSKVYNYQIFYPSDKKWSVTPHSTSEEPQDPINTARLSINNKFSLEVKVFTQYNKEIPTDSKTINVSEEIGYFYKSDLNEKILLFNHKEYGYSLTFSNTSQFNSEEDFEDFVVKIISTFKFLD